MEAKIAAKLIIDCFNRGNKVFTCGNGGSATQALHMSGEFVGKFEYDRKSLPSICLNSDVGVLTAVANDFGFEFVFSRQLEGLGRAGDILITFSTSGKSRNVLRAIEMAKALGMTIIETPRLPDSSTAYIQEQHSRWVHDVCRIVEKSFIPLSL